MNLRFTHRGWESHSVRGTGLLSAAGAIRRGEPVRTTAILAVDAVWVRPRAGRPCYAERILNGPCGGSHEDHCEVDADRPCAWQLIYKRLSAIGQTARLEAIVPPKDWRAAWHAGARKVVRKEHRT